MSNRDEKPALVIAKAFTDSSGGLAIMTAGLLIMFADVMLLMRIAGAVMFVIGFAATIGRFALETVKCMPSTRGPRRWRARLASGVIGIFFSALLLAAIAGGVTAADALRPKPLDQTKAGAASSVTINVFLHSDRVSSSAVNDASPTSRPVATVLRRVSRTKPKCLCKNRTRK